MLSDGSLFVVDEVSGKNQKNTMIELGDISHKIIKDIKKDKEVHEENDGEVRESKG